MVAPTYKKLGTKVVLVTRGVNIYFRRSVFQSIHVIRKVCASCVKQQLLHPFNKIFLRLAFIYLYIIRNS